MRRISRLLLLPLLLLMLAAQAKADAVSVPDIEVNAGETPEIVINFSTTSTTLTGYQTSLYLPEGVTLQKDEDDEYLYELSSRHNKNHVFSVNEQADGGLLLVCYSPTKKTIKNGDGELLRLPINVAATATGTLQAQLKTIKFSDTSSNVSQLSDVTFSIKMPEPVVDDAVTVAPIETKAGEDSELVISFSTAKTTLTGYQMSLYLPAGVTLQKDEDEDYLYTLSSRHNKNHVFSVNEQADGGLLLVCYSPTKKIISAGSGELLRLPVSIAATATGTLQAQLKTIKFSDTSSTVYQLSDVTFNISVQSASQPLPQTLSLTTLPAMTYGDAAYTLPAKTDQGLALTWKSSNTAVAAISSGKLTIKGAGTAKITATQAGNASYQAFSREFTLTVAKAALTITADNKEKQQGEENPELTVSYKGFKYSDTASSLTKQPTVTTTATKDSPAGTYPITASGAEAKNYNISYVQGTLTVKESAIQPTGYTLYPAECSIHQGEKETMSIHLDNKEGVIMAEFYMQLPEGISIATDEDGYYDATLNADRSDRTHQLEVEKGSDGLYHFLAYSSKNKAFTGNEGELITVTLDCEQTVEAGIYQGMLTNILLSDADKQAIDLPNHTFDIEVTDYILGDVNDDRRINGMDIVEMVDLIMSQGYTKAADLYPVGLPDGKVNGMDLVEEVELVMSQTATASGRLMVADGSLQQGLTLTTKDDGSLTLGVDAGRAFTMVQTVVTLSDGMSLSDVTTDAHHTVAWRQVDESRYVVVAYSNSNRAFTENDALFTLHCTGMGDVAVGSTLMADTDKQEHHFAGVSAGETTGIYDNEKGIVNSEISASAQTIYDLQGRRMEGAEANSSLFTHRSSLKKGVYIINGKKKVVK